MNLPGSTLMRRAIFAALVALASIAVCVFVFALLQDVQRMNDIDASQGPALAFPRAWLLSSIPTMGF